MSTDGILPGNVKNQALFLLNILEISPEFIQLDLIWRQYERISFHFHLGKVLKNYFDDP